MNQPNEQEQLGEAYTKAELGGFELTIRLPLSREKLSEIAQSINCIRELGFTPRGQQPEEVRVETVDAIVVRETDDGTPVVAFYSPRQELEHNLAYVYVGDDETRRAIEDAAGVKLDEVKRYPNGSFPRRGIAGNYLIPTRQFKIQLDVNPKWLEWKEKDEVERTGTHQPQKWVVKAIIGAAREQKQYRVRTDEIPRLPPISLMKYMRELARKYRYGTLTEAQKQEIMEALRRVVGDENVRNFVFKVFQTETLPNGGYLVIKKMVAKPYAGRRQG